MFAFDNILRPRKGTINCKNYMQKIYLYYMTHSWGLLQTEHDDAFLLNGFQYYQNQISNFHHSVCNHSDLFSFQIIRMVQFRS